LVVDVGYGGCNILYVFGKCVVFLHVIHSFCLQEKKKAKGKEKKLKVNKK